MKRDFTVSFFYDNTRFSFVVHQDSIKTAINAAVANAYKSVKKPAERNKKDLAILISMIKSSPKDFHLVVKDSLPHDKPKQVEPNPKPTEDEFKRNLERLRAIKNLFKPDNQ